MRKQIALWGICIILPLLIGLIWRNECITYQKYINNSRLEGTISTWKSGENFDGNHLILLNPNEVSDYVEFDFSFVKKYTGVGYIDSIFFDGNGFYVVATESEKNPQVKLFYVSPVGINQIAENLSCLNWAFSGFIKSGNTLFLKLDQKLYEIDDITKTLRLVKDFGLNKVRAYPYKNGIVYQYNNEVRAYSESGDILLFYLPDNIRFDGWYETGQSVFVSTPNRETYIMDYGEDRFAKNIAKHIVAARKEKPIETTFELNEIIKASIPAKVRATGGHPSKRTYQAIRIELNRELDVLENSIDMMIDRLNPQGRLCIITFHSLEDRIVKARFRNNENPCTCPPDFPVCVCGKKSKGKVITRKPIVPGDEELNENQRSKSSKLRVFERI